MNTEPDQIGDDVVVRSLSALATLEKLVEQLVEGAVDSDRLAMNRVKAVNALILSTTRVTRNVALVQRVAKVELENRKLRNEVETLAKKLHEEVVRRHSHETLPESKY